MPGPIAMMAADALIGGIGGQIFGSFNDARQIKQQKKLQAIQIAGQKEMTDFNMDRQLKMWRDTSYPAQLEMMKKAGINPGLMYGMGGGGGQTANITGGNVSGGTAPSGGGESIAMMQMGLNLGLMKAQKDVLETQAQKNEAEATKIKGIDTQEGVQRMEESKTRIDALLQGIDNAKQQNTIQKLEITLKNMENYEKQASQEDRLDYIEYQTKIAAKQLKLLTNEGYISDKTMKDKISIVASNAITAALMPKLTMAQTDVERAKFRSITESIIRDWDKMNQTEREIRIKEDLKDWNTDPNREAINHAINSISTILSTLKKGTTINNFYE